MFNLSRPVTIVTIDVSNILIMDAKCKQYYVQVSHVYSASEID